MREIIADQPQIDLKADLASFIDDLGADSLDIAEPVMAMEDAFEMEIPMRPRRSPPSRM